CFQAEDGILGATVTGVQTCALPICHPYSAARVMKISSVTTEPSSALVITAAPLPTSGNRISSQRKPSLLPPWPKWNPLPLPSRDGPRPKGAFCTVNIWVAICLESTLLERPARAAAISSAHLARYVGVVQSPAAAISG